MDKIENMQTKDRIAAILRTEILSGRIVDGEELTQELIAKSLNVSRMPVREALQILELEGLLRRLPSRHMQAVGLQEEAIRQNLSVLAAIEAEVAWILATSKTDVSVLNPSNEQQFHTSLSGLTKNHCIEQTHRRLLNIYPYYVWDNVSRRTETTQMNKTIQTAILAGDEELINKSVRQYYRIMADDLMKHVKENASHE